MHDDKDEDVESGNGPSLAQSPVSDVETSARPVSGDAPELNYNKLVSVVFEIVATIKRTIIASKVEMK